MLYNKSPPAPCQNNEIFELNWIEFIHIPQNPKTGITTGYRTSQSELNTNLNFIIFDGSFYWAQSSASIILDITIKNFQQ
jgi:hypothetical protein